MIGGGSVAAAADEPPPSPCAIEEGRPVRVARVGEPLVEAPFAGCRDDTLLLVTADGLLAVPLADATGLWVRDRETRRGFAAGGVVGAVAGGVLGVAVGSLANAMEDGDNDVGVVLAGGVGAAMGLITGGILGAAVGSAIPGWREVPLAGAAPPPAPPDEAGVAPREDGGRLGSLGVQVGGAWSSKRASSTAGLIAGAAFGAETRGGFGLSVELARHRAGPQPYDAEPAAPPARERVWLFGVVARQELARGAVRPYVTAGLGRYQWDDTFVGGSLGAGIALPLAADRSVVRVEYRRHENLQRLAGSDPGFHAVTVGLARTW